MYLICIWHAAAPPQPGRGGPIYIFRAPDRRLRTKKEKEKKNALDLNSR